MAAERALLMVWDGLRPDAVSPEATPSLWQLAQQGVWFEHSHAVYPTLTRANSPAISTGCRPGRAGVPGNTFCLPSATRRRREYSSGDAANLQRLADADGRPILLVDTLADRVHRAGGSTVVVGSGSPGSMFLQHPRAVDCGDPVIGEGVDWMAPFMDALRARFGAPPRGRCRPPPGTPTLRGSSPSSCSPSMTPTLLVFWHTDPTTPATTAARAHETAARVARRGRQSGAILAAYARLGLRDSTAVVVTSDHGSSSVTRRVQPARDLAASTAGLRRGRKWRLRLRVHGRPSYRGARHP